MNMKHEEIYFPKPNRPLIGLNGRFLVAQRTGVQRSAYWLFRSIIETASDFNFVLFTSAEEGRAPEWQRDNVRIVACSLASQNVFRNHMWEQFSLPKLAMEYGVQILHNPANLAPVGYRGKSVVNIHDVCFLVEPSWFSWTFRMTYSFLVPRIAKNASVVITNSNNSKNDILEHLKVETSKVRFSYWAVDPLFFQFNSPYALRDDQMLFVGSLEPRKNLSGLIEAFTLYREKNPARKTKLLVVGCENPLFANVNYNLGPYASDVQFVGYIDDMELARLYGRSKAFVYPSFYEGFGFPPLEAMAAGTPVITSWNSSLPEVVGDAAVLVNPADPSDIANAIENVLTSDEFAQYLITKGIERAHSFRWETVAHHSLSIYKELLK